jgi:single-stranded-DNA-specific exonuclease
MKSGASHKAWHVAPRISPEAIWGLAPFSPLAAQLLHNRGITHLAAAEAFLALDETMLEDSLLLPDMGSAIARLQRALADGETIGIFGDFDADGITGTALLAEGLEALGAGVIPYLPHRVKEGHGLSSQAVRTLHERGVTLIVTVDCGITSPDEVDEAASLGIDTIITDHHTPPSQDSRRPGHCKPQAGGVGVPVSQPGRGWAGLQTGAGPIPAHGSTLG